MLGDYTPTKGSTLLIPSGTSSNPDGKHLFFILTNPCAGNQHLLVSATSVKPARAHDPTCLLAAGAHPFIEHQSYIFYAGVKQLPHSGIIKCVSGTIYTPKEPCDPQLLERIRAGVTVSAMTPRWAKEYFRINGNR